MTTFTDRTNDNREPFLAYQDNTTDAQDDAAEGIAAALQAATRDESPVSAISITPATKTLVAEATQQLAVATTPANKGVSVVYTTSDATKATVDAYGLVTAVASGSATITGTAVHDGALTDTCVVTVS